LQRRKIRTRQRELGAAFAAALCLAGCGGGDKDAAPQPTLHRQLAVALADQSDSIARALDAGDDCKALDLAVALQQQTITAINGGRVPTSFQEPLQDRVNDLAGRIRCLPPVETGDRGKGHGKGKKKHHKGGD
jgi:hypothetical protein